MITEIMKRSWYSSIA